MMKFAAAALFCSASLVLLSGTADARCGCKKNRCKSSCCAPAPTCCTPAPACSAPDGTAPAAPADAAPPAPTADVGPLNGDPALAMSPDGQQSYRSYSADTTQPAANNAAPATPAKPKQTSNFFRANRKMQGIR